MSATDYNLNAVRLAVESLSVLLPYLGNHKRTDEARGAFVELSDRLSMVAAKLHEDQPTERAALMGLATEVLDYYTS